MFFRLPIVKFFSRLLNRATITVALVLLQAGWLLWAFSYLTTGRIWVNAALRLLSLFIVLYLVRKDEDSSYKIIWIVLIGLLPLLGGALYLVFGNKAPSKGMRRRMQSVEKAHTGDLAQQPGPARQLAGDHFSGLSRYVARYGPFPVWDKTQARYFSCGEAMYPKLLADLEKAEKFIFLEYFIVRSGKMWSGVEEILMRKAAQGVDVRLIYDGLVQPYADSPLDEENVAETVYLNILAQAKRYVYLYTPYFSVGQELLGAMKGAAKRGVDVRLILPGIPDKKLVFRLTRSYYVPLLRAGVKIYEYTPGFLHAKCYVSDDHVAVVGSINMDYRSLFLHFECGTLLYRNSQILALRDDALNTLRKCREVQLSDCRTNLLGTLLDSVLRLLSPLM